MQKTDLNVAPYYDDFDVTDNFHRVLFRPGFAVQARELTTLQSIMQNQIERHGRHFFKEGSMVIPGQISYTNTYYAVKLQSTFNSAAIAGYLSSFVGSIVTGGISGITARVVGFTDATTTDAPTLYVKYLTTATNSASATLNKWLKEKLINDYVIHGFRHSFRDRLRAIECPSEIIDQLGGWSLKSVGQGYGKGYELSVLGKWLLKI